MAGLTAASGLQRAGCCVLVLDKGRGVGGRLATRRTDAGSFDHGAQFFTARDSQFRLLVEAWQAAGIVRAWATGFALADGTFKRDGETRFCGVNGMASIAKHLAHLVPVVARCAGPVFDGDAPGGPTARVTCDALRCGPRPEAKIILQQRSLEVGGQDAQDLFQAAPPAQPLPEAFDPTGMESIGGFALPITSRSFRKRSWFHSSLLRNSVAFAGLPA